ncbi:GNAT family N-acetyltransferase [Sphingobium sp. LB126]|uniref:GNAT family N-acetyltransferase n=1 Tax=Sphingobium sp. LB126 TaxID=1983755 RepID=UPI000C20D888|nr:GNAT family N-acetyltransferase [Sphingobium sp. LB126]PJG49421.1 GNAT family N-acetyltransferase [Sphingobium sp. LB126]
MSDGWMSMREADLPTVKVISDTVHGAYTEDEAIYAERLALYPSGCLILRSEGQPLGYLIAHPWRSEQPPALNMRLGGIPADADVYYLHDIALLPSARGTGAGKSAMAKVVEQARTEGFAAIRLMAVNGADSFWSSQGFVRLPDGSASYGDASVFMERRL